MLGSNGLLYQKHKITNYVHTSVIMSIKSTQLQPCRHVEKKSVITNIVFLHELATTSGNTNNLVCLL